MEIVKGDARREEGGRAAAARARAGAGDASSSRARNLCDDDDDANRAGKRCLTPVLSPSSSLGCARDEVERDGNRRRRR